MSTSCLLRCSFSVAIIMSQPVNALSPLAQAMGPCTFGHKLWCGKVKLVPKSTEEQRSSQVQMAESFPKGTSSKCCCHAVTEAEFDSRYSKLSSNIKPKSCWQV